MKSSRRTFLQNCFAGAALATSPDAARAQSEKTSPGWIDAHVHVWTPDTKRYPLGPNFERSAMQPPSFTPEELFAHSKPAGVDRIVLIQMSFYENDNAYMLKAMREHPGVFSGVALVDHRREDIGAHLKQLSQAGVRGIRLHSRGDAKQWPNAPAMNRLWQLGAQLGIAMCPLINPADLPFVDTLCQRHADTTVVVDHFARVGISGTVVPEELDALCRLSRFKKTHVKTSAFYALGKKSPPYQDLLPMIRRVCDAFGPERLMWASDCPYQVQGKHNYESSIALIRDHADFLSNGDKQWLLRDTAEKVFFS